jgi:hypothetical protein
MGQMLKGYMQNMTQGGNHDYLQNMMGGFGNNFGNENEDNSWSNNDNSNPWLNNSSSNNQKVEKKEPEKKKFQDIKELIKYDKAKLDLILKKLNQIIKEEKIENIVIEEKEFKKPNKDLIEKLRKIIYKLDLLLNKLEEKKVFPVLDLYRFILNNKEIVKLSLVENGILNTIKNSYLVNWKNCTSATQLMLIRIYSNLIEFSPTYVLSEIIGTNIADGISDMLSNEKEQIRITALSLACNMALYAVNDNNDIEVQLLSSMIHYYSKEVNDDAFYKMLLVIYRLTINNKDSIILFKELGGDIYNINEKIIKNENINLILSSLSELFK